MSSLLRCSAGGFSMLELELESRLAEQMAHVTGRRPSPAERRSWSRSLPVLAADLQDAGLSGVEMLVEYQLPLTSKRADVVLAGVGRRTGEPAYVVVELKQWSEATRFEDSDELVVVPGYGARPVTHPVRQVGGYVEYLTDFTAALADTKDAVRGVAYLHNATDDGVGDLLRPDGPASARLFTGQRRSELAGYLRDVFAPTSGAESADVLLGSAIRPSRQLMAVAADEVQRREMFTLLDEQRDAYNYVLHSVRTASHSSTKTAVVISGGPGSGKSVVALSLMGELGRQGRTVVHATGSQSFTQTLRRVAAARNPRVRKTFQYFNSFMSMEANALDCVILDEAHRIRETSVNRYTRAHLRSGRPQIDELLSVARTPVFLLDQHQVVRPGELGTVADIRAAAAARGMEVLHVDLDAQFRCGGSAAFIRWVEGLLGLGDAPAHRWQGEDTFSVELMESPHELEAWLAAKQQSGFGARLTAGYCWPWSDPRPDGSLVPDVQIDDWRRPWNLKGDRSIGGAPPAPLWATDPAGFGQVGCIYTAQGFEYDYAGVILGPDLVWRDGAWRTVRQANRDPALRNLSQVSNADVDRLVRNVYKVLLTRGMQGVGIFSPDRQTREHLSDLV
ncbi:hypothetical protein DFJ68_0105 [Terracoccus luteus]|uniref:AAA+ ATPase domain-containing protein n=1 Tax=Terracoccus luteus TaxID=53356 RepID=A0A495XT04_9MICO|nr:DUF2075 domain-containing protein [Terracoccus luteus]RKT76709.1 hypothetical protein DFJ68_0105 [Terracoccus luteus]